MTSRLNGAGVFSGNGVPVVEDFGNSNANGTPLYLDLATGLLYWLDESNTVQEVNTGFEPFGIGSIYLSIDSTDPNTTLGYGTWVRFGQGRMPISLDEGNPLFDTPEETGGFADAVVVDHTHIQDAHTHTQNSHSHTINNGTLVNRQSGSGAQATGGGVGSYQTLSNSSEVAVNQNTTATNQSTGVSGTDQNYPPFIAVYMWKRTA